MRAPPGGTMITADGIVMPDDRERLPCTLENCGHMRQLDDIVTFLGMHRGGISVLDELRRRRDEAKCDEILEELFTFRDRLSNLTANDLNDALKRMFDEVREEGRRAAFEEVQAVLVQPELWEERVRRALAMVTEYLTRPPSAT